MRRIFWDFRFCYAPVWFFLSVFVVESRAQEKEWQISNRPNIIILITHDTGQHFGCYGMKTVHSPNIDRLARQGVLLKEFFCTAPQCSPSRSSLYTGRFPHANGVMSVIQQEFEWDLHPGERHLAGFLKEAGYRTARIGSGHETRRPEEMGFTDIISVPAPRTCEEAAKVSSKFFQETAKDDRPFYAQVYFFETHRRFSFGGAKPDSSKGIYIPPYIIDEPSARKDFAEFQGAIRKMDASIGTILKALEDTGLSENTIVIYTVDHGIPFPRAKMTPYDAGIEVACLIR
ncbi:MAG: sulfatase-like hydrolase/transferase, partial [Planctomycetota bacterium]